MSRSPKIWVSKTMSVWERLKTVVDMHWMMLNITKAVSRSNGASVGMRGTQMSLVTPLLTFSAHCWCEHANDPSPVSLWLAEPNSGSGVWPHQSAVLWHLHHGAHLPQYGDHDGGDWWPKSREGGFPLQSKRGFHCCFHGRVLVEAFRLATVLLHQWMEHFWFCCSHLVHSWWVF